MAVMAFSVEATWASVAPAEFFMVWARMAWALASSAAASIDAFPNSTTLSTANAPPIANAAFFPNSTSPLAESEVSSAAFFNPDASPRNRTMTDGPASSTSAGWRAGSRPPPVA
jgi:hypothetical protein